MTKEERAYNYASTCKATKLQVGEIAKHYNNGYETAEKDLALTLEDIELLHTFLYAVKNNKHGAFTFTRLSNEQYQEVLNRFNKSKEK